MRKYIVIIIMIMFLTTGCTINTEIKNSDVLKIKDNSISLLKDDYSELLQYINHLSFSKRKEKINASNTMTITTNDNIHIFQISKDYKIKYQVNKMTYYSSNKKTIKKIVDLLEKLQKEYLNQNFYDISELTDYKEEKNDILIKIDNVSQYFLIKSNQELKKLQIHKVEFKDNKYHDIDLIHEQNNIKKNHRMIFRMNPQKDYFRYRISFINKYGLSVSIIPTYDIEKETGKIQYIKNISYPE